ncbi:17426_t:CDS:2 [Funneliformis caledonium]|uniref:17426_t:CDS:1 n=1 Tax=Funneliformis caledonium TaxID=1117310 RepID=A0A9N9GL08_9GLOM|nr:17426_t:CDS:2 [Funneliformis caledonium]
MNTVIKFNSFISILLLFSLFSLFALFNEVTALAIHKPRYNPLNPDCVSYQFISPKADDKIKVTDEIEVVWKRDSSKIIEVQGLDLYDENGKFIDSLTSHRSIFGADDKASIKVKLIVLLDKSLTGKFMFKTVSSTGEGPTCPEFSKKFYLVDNTE